MQKAYKTTLLFLAYKFDSFYHKMQAKYLKFTKNLLF